MYKIEISKFAFVEIEESKEYYNLQKENLGIDFKRDVYKVFNNILLHPKLYPIIKGDIRRCLLHRFPYSIFYVMRNQTIVVLSVAHQHRKPNH